MELVLNELSHIPLSVDKYKANELMLLFSKTVAEARKKGFRKIRTHFSASEIKLANEYSLHNWLFDKEFPVEFRALFYDMLVQPFIKEGDDDVEEKYIEATYFFEDVENNISKQECLGLASAYLSETIAISIQSNQAWLKNILKITIEKDGEANSDDVNHVFSKNCFSVAPINNFVEEISTLTLIETTINPNDKKIHLTTHHGQKELNELWSKLKNSPYVIEGMSIEWGGNSFFKNPTNDGKVDIVHLKSDKRYVLQIQTTGRTLRETKVIAEMLKKEYSH
ncbi:MAG: hypothetical protein HXX16_13760 [Bacteroidales bacterium]|nr:hypothetical protein [Bacteroidales bacterium]